MLNEVDDDDLLFLFPLTFVWSREEETEEPLWFVEHKLLLEELLLSENHKNYQNPSKISNLLHIQQ